MLRVILFIIGCFYCTNCGGVIIGIPFAILDDISDIVREILARHPLKKKS